MPNARIILDTLRRYATSRSLFAPTTLPKAVERLGFVQADPIRAPARAQDLILRHRVKNYSAGELERRYAKLDVEEDFFVNYGFLPRSTQALMHPRTPRGAWPKARVAQAASVLAFVRDRGAVHPKEVDAHFAHGRTRNAFGGTSNASTQTLDAMHYRGMLRVAGRKNGIRTYAIAEHLPKQCEDPALAMDALIDVIVHQYAPLPERSLRELINLLRGGVPHWDAMRAAAFARAKARLPSVELEGCNWYWPESESPNSSRYKMQEDKVRLLAPFDPVVWDRRRFEIFWNWAYRFEAYTPAPKRIRGYYALPLLWRSHVIGWGNLTMQDGKLQAEIGYATGQAPRDNTFRSALEEELDQMQSFLLLK